MNPASPDRGPVPAADSGSGSSASPEASRQPTVQPALDAVPPWAWGVFALLFAMHVLDSADRWLLTAVLPQIDQELELSANQEGWLSTGLLLSFAIVAPPFGYLADRLRRPRLLALGFALESLATVVSGLARTYDQLLAARVLVGVGSAVFMVIALTWLMDLFPSRMRGRVLAGFFLAMPLGAALELIWRAAFASWQTAFLAAGAPGLLLALLSLAVPEPVRGESEGIDIARLRLHEQVGPSREDYIDLMVNSSYTYSVFGIAFSSFAIAGVVYWLPTFLTVVKGLTAATTSVDRLLGGDSSSRRPSLGIGAGGWLADTFAIRRPRMVFTLPGLAMLGSIGCVLVAIHGRGVPWVFGGIFLAVRLMSLEIGPCYAIISRVVMPNMRAVACAVDPLGHTPPGRSLVADSDGMGHRHLRSGRFHGHPVRPRPGRAWVPCQSPSPATTLRTSPPACWPPASLVDLRHRPAGRLAPPPARDGAHARQAPGGSQPSSRPQEVAQAIQHDSSRESVCKA